VIGARPACAASRATLAGPPWQAQPHPGGRGVAQSCWPPHLHAARPGARHAPPGRPGGRLGRAWGAGGGAPADCLRRWPVSAVIVTTSAMTALDSGQLDAVLAHERAHRHRHHALKAAARIRRQVLPFLPLLRDTEAQWHGYRTARRRRGHPRRRPRGAGHGPGPATSARATPRQPSPRRPPTRCGGYTRCWGCRTIGAAAPALLRATAARRPHPCCALTPAVAALAWPGSRRLTGPIRAG
jgi:hypothetical protein